MLVFNRPRRYIYYFFRKVGFPFRNLLSASAEEKKSNFSTLMAAMNPIEISSSDSELEIEDEGDRNTSSLRVLPEWEVTHGTNSRSTG